MLILFSSIALAAGPEFVLDWNDALLDAIRSSAKAPPLASRELAILNTAMADALFSASGSHETWLIDNRPRRDVNGEAAVIGAGYAVLSALHPSSEVSHRALLQEQLAGLEPSPETRRGLVWGYHVGLRLLSWRAQDGWDQSITYEPGEDIGDWRPTPSGYAPALLPWWPDVEPWALSTGDELRPAGPPGLLSADYTAAFEETTLYGRASGSLRSADQTEIAYFWADGPGTCTPPGHWFEIASAVTEDAGLDLEEALRLHAILGAAVADAAIVAWDAKYTYEHFRPVTAISEDAAMDGNPATSLDTAWRPLLGTPPFPEYISGHSTFSSAAATVLAGFLGDDDYPLIVPADPASAVPGVTRRFDSFSGAAAEAGQSRIYGGIHWQYGNQDGLEAGRQVGERALAELYRPR
jgi:hypothetical protein